MKYVFVILLIYSNLLYSSEMSPKVLDSAGYDVSIYDLPNSNKSIIEIVYHGKVYNIKVKTKDLDKVDTKKLIKEVLADYYK